MIEPEKTQISINMGHKHCMLDN